MDDLAKTVCFVPAVIDSLAQLMRQQCGKDIEKYPWVTLSGPGKKRWIKKAEAVVAGLPKMTSNN